MAAKSPTTERRQFTRFTVKDAVIAFNAQVGELIDISFGGLAFVYTATRSWPRQPSETALLCGEDDFCLQVPLKTIADSPLKQKNTNASPLKMRRRSMQFGELSASQLLQLVAFIRDNTLAQELPEAGESLHDA